MKIIISVLFVLASFQAAAEIPGCEKCVDTPNIAPKAITTGKIAPNAVTRSKLAPGSVGNSEIVDGTIGTEKFAPEVQRKMHGLAVRDGVGRLLPITITHTTSLTAHGYYVMEDSAVIPIVIEKPLYSDQPAQIWSNTGQGSGPWPYNRFWINSVSYTGTDCKGQSFIAPGFGPSPSVGNSPEDFLFDHFMIIDSDAPNRSRLVFRVGENISGAVVTRSTRGSGGCVDSTLQFQALIENALEVVEVGAIRWAPPLKVSAFKSGD
jgi:hypothetical protein